MNSSQLKIIQLGFTFTSHFIKSREIIIKTDEVTIILGIWIDFNETKP